MPTNFPGGIDALTNPTGTDQLNSPSHADQHANANDAIEAMQTVMTTTPVGVVLTHSTTQSIANITSVAATFDSESYDPYGFHAGGAPTRITIPTGMGGIYLVSAQLSYGANATGIRYMIFYVNGVPLAQHQSAAASGDRTHMLASWTFQLSAGNYVEVYARQDSGGALNIGHANVELRNKFSAFRL